MSSDQPPSERELLEQLLATLERQASGTLATVVKIRAELARLREPAANEERAPALVPEVTRQRLLHYLAGTGHVPSGDPANDKPRKKRATR